ELFRRQLDEIELAERIGIDQIWFYEHHLKPSAPVPSPNLLIAAAAQRTCRNRYACMVNILTFRDPLLVALKAAFLDNLIIGRLGPRRGPICYNTGNCGTATRSSQTAVGSPTATISGDGKRQCCTRWISTRSSRTTW